MLGRATNGGIAQLARAFGSYPKCRWFKSDCRYHCVQAVKTALYRWPVGQAVKTPPFHGGIMGSIPVRVTKKIQGSFEPCIFFIYAPWGDFLFIPFGGIFVYVL